MDRYRKSTVEAFEKAETLVRAWLEEEGITRVDVYLNGLGDVGDTLCWRIADGEKKSVHIDRSAGSAINKLRGIQALPGRDCTYSMTSSRLSDETKRSSRPIESCCSL